MSESVTLGSPAHRARIIRNLRGVREELRQVFRDADHWNCHVRTPDQAALDVDPDGRFRQLLESIEFTLACDAAAGGIGPIEPIELGPRVAADRERH